MSKYEMMTAKIELIKRMGHGEETLPGLLEIRGNLTIEQAEAEA